MNQDLPSPDDERKVAFIDSLLQSVYEADSPQSKDRIDQVMARIRNSIRSSSTETANLSEHHAANKSYAEKASWRRLITSSLAAGILLTAFLVFQSFSTTQQLMAAIEKGKAAAAEDVARHYRVVAVYKNLKSPQWITSRTQQNQDSTRSFITSDLYVRGNDRFALRHPALVPGADLWIGKNQEQAWIVPAIGAVRVGKDSLLTKWLSARERLSTPYLHITTVLNRISRGYRLEESGESEIQLDNGTSVRCRKIVGTSKRRRDDLLPDRIELYSDLESGLVMRLNIEWHLENDQSGRERVEIEFVGQPALDEDWFRPEGHYQGSRRRIELDLDLDGNQLD